MASISSVVTMGYGNGTFVGDVNLLPTLGYGQGAVAAADYTLTLTIDTNPSLTFNVSRSVSLTLEK